MDELVKRVRQVAEEVCDDYDVDPYNAEQRFFVIEEAADAIEELSREYESIAKSLNESVELVRKLNQQVECWMRWLREECKNEN